MKELYSFEVTRDVATKQKYMRKTASGEKEATRTVKNKKTNRIIIEKPSVSDIERAEFFYGQKYNEYINAGFLTRAMLAAKISSVENKAISEEVKNAILANIEASKTIQFYEGHKNISEEQQKKLDDAKSKFSESQMMLLEHESALRDQFSQTADVKAEERMIEWFVFYFSFYEDEVDGEKELFPIFEGNDFEEKRESYLTLCEEEEEIDDERILVVKGLFDEAFEKIGQVINIWYNKMGKNQKEIDEKIEELFGKTEEEEEKPKKSKKKKEGS